MKSLTVSCMPELIVFLFALEGCATFSPDKVAYKNIDKTVSRRETTCAVGAPRNQLVITPIADEQAVPETMSLSVTRRILVDSMVILTTTIERTTKKFLRENGANKTGFLSLGIVFGGFGVWCVARGSLGGLTLGGLSLALSYVTLRGYFSLADSNSTVVRSDTLGVKHILLEEVNLSNALVTVSYDGDVASPDEILLDEHGCGNLNISSRVGKNFAGQTTGTLRWKDAEAPIRLPTEICEHEVRSMTKSGDWKHLESVLRKGDLPSAAMRLATDALEDYRISQRKRPTVTWLGVSAEIQHAISVAMNSKKFDYFSSVYEKSGVSDIQIRFEYSEDRGASLDLFITTKSLGMLTGMGAGRFLWLPPLSINSAVGALIGMGFVANYRSTLTGEYLSDALKNIRVTLRTPADSSHLVTLWLSVYPRQTEPPLLLYSGQIEVTHRTMTKRRRRAKLEVDDRLVQAQYKLNYGLLLPNTTDYSGNKNSAVDLLIDLIRHGQ